MNDFNNTAPIYIQIMDDIKRCIISGSLKSGEKLPSVRGLAEKLKVNPNTVIRSYAELEREKVTETRRGTGTFITEDKKVIEAIREKISSSQVEVFVRNMKESGFSAEKIIRLVQKKLENE